MNEKMNIFENNGMVEMTEEEFDKYFIRKADAPDVAKKAEEIFNSQPDLPYVEIDGIVVPNLKLLED